MRRRSTTTTTRKSSAAAALLTSSPPPSIPAAATSPSLSSPSQSPPLPEFHFHFNDATASISRKNKMMNSKNKNNGGGSKLMMMQLQLQQQQPDSSPQKQQQQQQRQSVNTISDLKDMVSSDLESLKRHLDRSHSEILKDVEASHSRLHKRFKMQSQTCQQLMDESEKEYKKMSERISEGREAMKASYAEFMAEVQASASCICKTSIPELSQTMEKGIASLRNRYGILSTASLQLDTLSESS